MDWQQLVSLFIVAAVGVLLVWGKFRRRRLGLHRQTHCGCAVAGLGAASQGSILFRARKGQRPEVVVILK